MIVGVCRVELQLPENDSLKGKRRVVRSIIQRVRNEFNVAVAEVDNQDRWQLATLAIGCLSTDGKHANEVLSKAVRFIEGLRVEAVLADFTIDLFPA